MKNFETPHGEVPGNPAIALPNAVSLGVRLKLARQTRGFTLKALSATVGCSESLLSKIEHGKASPSLPMLHRLVKALNTNVAWMFEESDGEEGIVFRSGTRPLISLDTLRQGKGIQLERIIPYSQGHLLQCNIHHVEKDGVSAGPIEHAGEEVGYVVSGEIELTVGEQTFRVGQGDAFVFRSELPHQYRNVGDSPASIFWVNTPTTFYQDFGLPRTGGPVAEAAPASTPPPPDTPSEITSGLPLAKPP